jgi:hypothetical protein
LIPTLVDAPPGPVMLMVPVPALHGWSFSLPEMVSSYFDPFGVIAVGVFKGDVTPDTDSIGVAHAVLSLTGSEILTE